MLFYDCESAPSPRRVRIFAAEKGIELPRMAVDLRRSEQFQQEFRGLNPWCTVPILVLTDGTVIAESVAICEYLEGIHPEPALFGADPVERACTLMWERRMELAGFFPVIDAFRNSIPALHNRAVPGPHPVKQIPALAERGRERYRRFLADLDERLGGAGFVAGGRFTIADITAFVTLEFARRAIRTEPPARLRNLQRWYGEICERPSASA